MKYLSLLALILVGCQTVEKNEDSLTAMAGQAAEEVVTDAFAEIKGKKSPTGPNNN